VAEVFVKLCGMTRAEDVAAAAEAGADAVGFVIAPDSPRGVEFPVARALASGAPDGLRTVAVYADTAIHLHCWDDFDLVQVYGMVGRPNARTIIGVRG